MTRPGADVPSDSGRIQRRTSRTGYTEGTGDRIWGAAARLILDRADEKTVQYTLFAYAGKIVPGHPAIRLLEEYRAFLRGSRGPLTADEEAPLIREARRLGVMPIAPI
jgi:hypothetical protein